MNRTDPGRLSGRDALAAEVGDRFSADWQSNNHRARRLVSELIGTSGLTFVLSGGAAILADFGGAALLGQGGHLAATIPQPGQLWQAVGFEAILTFGMVLLVLSMANGPKLNGSFVPIAVGAYVMAMGTMGGPYDGAAFNPARAFGPDVARGDLSTYWVYPLGSLGGVLVAVATERFLRGPAKAQESEAAMGIPLQPDQ